VRRTNDTVGGGVQDYRAKKPLRVDLKRKLAEADFGKGCVGYRKVLGVIKVVQSVLIGIVLGDQGASVGWEDILKSEHALTEVSGN